MLCRQCNRAVQPVWLWAAKSELLSPHPASYPLTPQAMALSMLASSPEGGLREVSVLTRWLQ